MAAELSATLRAFIDQHMLTLDHVALLVALREQPASAHAPTALAERSRLDRVVVDRVIADLLAAQLVRWEGSEIQYTPPSDQRQIVDELATAYRTMPVTLVRAIYARPNRAARSFAEAFRVRKENE